MTEEDRFLLYRTQMPDILRAMYDYDTMLSKIISKISDDKKLEKDELILLLNYLTDLKLYHKFHKNNNDEG